jgi:hypothetical protein
MLTQARLKELLHYDPETGVFTWRVPPSGRVAAGERAGFVHEQKYRCIRISGRKYREHRLAWLYVNGRWPPNQIDHRDGNILNNRIDNLREASSSQNRANSRISVKNTSGYKGVSWDVSKGKWSARIGVAGKQIHLGRYHCPEKAHAAYCTAAERYFGEFARAA